MIRIYLALGSLAAAYVAGGYTVWQVWRVADLQATVRAADDRIAALKEANTTAARIASEAAQAARDARARIADLEATTRDITAEFRNEPPAPGCDCRLRPADVDRLRRIPIGAPRPPDPPAR